MSDLYPAELPLDDEPLSSLAWAAGLFEGEGFITQRRGRSRSYMSFGIEMCDVDVVERFVEVMKKGGLKPTVGKSGNQQLAGITRRKRANPAHKDIYHWATTGSTGEYCYLILRPYLGKRRRQRGDEIMAAVGKERAERHADVPCAFCGKRFWRKRYGNTALYCSDECRRQRKLTSPAYQAWLASRRKAAA